MTASGALGTCPMLEVEQQRTNFIRNSSMVGAATPNTLPTNWSAGLPAGFTREVVDVGTESGFPYVDIRYFGTTPTSSFVGLTFETNTQIAAASGQAWAYSFYFKKIAGTIPSSAMQMGEYNSSGGFLTNSGISVAFNTATTLTRFSGTRIMTQATTAFTNAFIRIDVTALVAYDFTMRFYAPQIELGSFASTWVPTTTAAVTRLRDEISISGASALIGQTEGTIFLDVDFRVVSAGGIRVFFSIEGSVGSQFSGVQVGTTNNGNDIQYAGTSYDLTQGRHKIVCTYNSTTNQRKLFVDGAQRGATGTSPAFLATIDRISVLGRPNPFSGFVVDRQIFGGCNQFVVFKTALSNAQCIELSTL
jgi:hypothetical protein